MALWVRVSFEGHASKGVVNLLGQSTPPITDQREERAVLDRWAI